MDQRREPARADSSDVGGTGDTSNMSSNAGAPSGRCTCAWHMGMRDPEPDCTYGHATPKRDKVSWTWDDQAGMGYLRILPGRKVHATHMEAGDGEARINVDFDDDGNVIGVEVFG